VAGQALLLSVGAGSYALPLERVQEVLRRPVVVPLPGAPGAVLGVVDVRGEIVPVLDTAVLLGGAPGAGTPYVAVARTAAGPAGLVADGEPQTAPVPGGEIELLDLDALVAPVRQAGAAG